MLDLKKQKTESFILKNISRDQAKDTGMAMVLISLLAGLLGQKQLLIVLAVALLIINMTLPLAYRPVAVVWLGLSHLLGTVMSKIILTVLFFLLVTPVGLMRRASGADTLQLKKWKKSRSSVFKIRNHRFNAKDIKVPY